MVEISKRYNKYYAWIFGMTLAVLSFIWAFFLDAGDVWQYAIICIFSGMALGSDLALPPSILADHIHKTNNETHAATCYALLAFLSKVSLALASAIALPLLGIAGFVPAQENTNSALFFLSTSYALIPCILKLLSGTLLWRMTTSLSQGADHEKNKTYTDIRSSHHA